MVQNYEKRRFDCNGADRGTGKEGYGLAQVMLLRKGFISQDLKQTMKSSSTSWILNYELFSENIITEDEFKEKLTIHQNLNMYNKLKQKGIHFCEF